jgi:hypothetical protein
MAPGLHNHHKGAGFIFLLTRHAVTLADKHDCGALLHDPPT